MNNEIFFSIIIPTFNRAHLIEKTITSCLNQNYRHFEIVVVDDGSADGTEEVIKQIQTDKIRYYRIPNSERGYARNFGAGLAKGNWINFFDSDDLFYQNHLSYAFEVIRDHPGIKIFHLSYEIIKGNFSHKPNVKSEHLIFGNVFSCNGVFLEKSFFLQNKFIEDRTIAGLEDWELWLRISAKHEIKTFHKITSAIIQHNERSVMQIDKEKWIKKTETFISYVENNLDIRKKYNKKMALFYCGAYTYLALHLAFDKRYKKEAVMYLIKGLSQYPLFVFKKRFFAILRHLFLT
ncbi:MAG: glycosyltransferase [Bacteroidia bacterium]|nr:glycosyltransferase [Bacteroidia bacterium]